MRKIVYVFLFFSIASCYSIQNINTNAQLISEKNSLQSNKDESNSNPSQPNINADESLPDGDAQTFAKTFFVKSRWDSSQNKIIHHPYLIEFKDNNSEGIGVYVDGKRKAYLKYETNKVNLRADFLEVGEKRYFVLVTGGAGVGTCGDSDFAIVELDSNLSVRISKPNNPNCQGELYNIKIENINMDKSKGFFRQISIGDLKFNLDSFEWTQNK